jgi:tetratricopeptide (TPR) repeat protein
LLGRTYKNAGTGVTQQEYCIRVTARITGNVQLVDLTTGKTLASSMFEGTNTLENTAVGGPPEPPSSEDARTSAYQNALDQLKRMILPWTETVSLIVYDDHKMGLDRSAGQIKAGDFAGAVETLQAVVDAGMTDPKAEKTYSKVYYNLGIAQMYSGQPDNAIKSLNKSAELRSTDITMDALATAHQMQQLQKQAEIVEAHPVEIGKEDKPASTEAKTSRLTNKDVLSMVAAKLPDSIIISKIKNSACQIDTSPDALIASKNAGASDNVILEITQLPPTQQNK